jgi:hypothetical protein
MSRGQEIYFAHTSFKWNNLASKNAGVTVIVVGVEKSPARQRQLFSEGENGLLSVRNVQYINSYLVAGSNVVVEPIRKAIGEQADMVKGNQPSDGGHLCLSRQERDALVKASPGSEHFIKKYLGAADYIRGNDRYCLWIEDKDAREANSIAEICERLKLVAEMRLNAVAPTTRPAAKWPHKFIQIQGIAKEYSILFPRICSERREYLPVGVLDSGCILSDQAFALYDAPIWNLALGSSRLHLVWIATVCGKLKTDFRYSNTLGWNTFPVPKLTQQNKVDLTRCAENILMAREAHFPATIADLYDLENMPNDLRRAHDENDEALERIYIGRRFRNDTERLEKLFELYTKMAAAQPTTNKKGRTAA